LLLFVHFTTDEEEAGIGFPEKALKHMDKFSPEISFYGKFSRIISKT
jgi:hypothetical protein